MTLKLIKPKPAAEIEARVAAGMKIVARLKKERTINTCSNRTKQGQRYAN